MSTISEKKRYLIETFIKRSKHDKTIRETLDFSYLILRERYPSIDDQKFAEIKKQHSLEEYVQKAIPIISQQFSEDELIELIHFHESNLGKKTSDISFLTQLIKISEEIINEAEQKLSINKI